MDAGERENAFFFHTYKRLPLEIVRGDGMYLHAKDGRRYLDMFGGVAVNALGHGHAGLLRAIAEQAGKYIHLSNYFLQEPQLDLAGLLAKYSGYGRVFFTNSGAEAMEGAIKLVRKWGVSRGKTEIVSFSHAFHGRTMGALSLMDRPNYLNGFGPFLPNCRIAPLNDSEALRSAVSEQTAAVVLEFIQGEGGITPATTDFVDTIRGLQSKFGFLVVADEIQSGIGRTGKFFGFQHYDITPDVVTIAKALGGGLPLGAILGGDRVSDVLEPGNHGSTFGGNPVACVAGIVLLREVMENGLLRNAATMGERLRDELLRIQSEFPAKVHEVRGRGLMSGMELTSPCDPVVAALRENGVLVNGTAERVLRFLPPLIVQDVHIREASAALRKVLSSEA